MMFFRGAQVMDRCIGFGAGYMRSGWGPLMMIGAFLAAVLIVVVIAVIIKRLHRNHAGGELFESLDLLNERFVKGEITEEEYIRMKKILKSR